MREISIFEQLRLLTAMNYVARCVHTVAELSVADAVGDEPAAVDAVAVRVGANADVLRRMLRATAAYGLFVLQDDRVSHSEMSRLLRSDHPSSLRDFVRMIALSVNWRAAEHLPHAARTGEVPMLRHAPDGVWAHYAEHPDDGRIFDAAMTSRASLMVPKICRSYDFSQFHTVVDIGGGRGHLLEAVLHQAPQTEGILFDLPHVVEAVRARNPHPRLRCEGGSFLTDRLPVADGYVLMEVLHDWPEEEAGQILRAIRRDAPSGARLLLMEIVPSDEPGPAWGTTLDIIMLAHFGGKQRTRAEYAALLAGSGFRLEREIDAGAGISIFEASVP